MIGVGLGLIAANVGGWIDQVLSWFVELVMAVPALILMLLLLSIFGTSIVSLIVIIAIVDMTRVFRLARSVALGVVVMDFVEAARLLLDHLA